MTLLREISDTVRELNHLNETNNRPEPEAHECEGFATCIVRQLEQLNADNVTSSLILEGLASLIRVSLPGIALAIR
jgi:hypothetical protein